MFYLLTSEHDCPEHEKIFKNNLDVFQGTQVAKV
jgi:hypothetical protein